MFRTRIKFCGIRRAADARAAVELGVDAIGFVLVAQSRRYIAPERAARLRAQLPPFVSAVALFMDATAEEVRRSVDLLRPDLLQFHGHEDPAFCASFGVPYMKAIGMGGASAPARSARRFGSAAALLLDGHAPGAMGGSGETFDWSKVGGLRRPLVLAGGLTPRNVGLAIRALRPYAVDVSSGIEQKPGVKDLDKMRAFVKAVRRADEAKR
ncbi:phosphoribosylanthranilate isomerase [Fontimonas sp. SYSU GA230001]|uniref:phosphoribosylanthranilate isomerase n=1 Tax=Fontimonas sp. SYSU GA230001 TaxID=3142450 RepID=UPI0032B505D7